MIRSIALLVVFGIYIIMMNIYVGGGDWDENQGPVDIWSFAVENSNSGYQFQKEITVDEESIERFRTCSGRLVVPGIDATESWKYGNVYMKIAQGRGSGTQTTFFF